MSRAFRLALQARDKLYRAGVFRVRRLDHPVVSVGNLTMGGTGKTPIVMLLAERFRDAGLRPAILSRGYRRKTRGVVVVSRGEGPLVEWTQAGDEPYLMARRLKGVAVVVGEDRYAAGVRAERENLGDFFILDDGFQHRRLHRNFDLVVIDPDEWNAGEALIPSGRWREPKIALSRANAICIREPGALQNRSALPIPGFGFRLQPDGLFDRQNRRVDPTNLRSSPIVAFAGIGKPERFFATLRQMGLEPSKCVPFRDHHEFSDAELKKLGAGVLVTTEKDAVRIGAGIEFLTLRVSATISDFEGLQRLIQARL